MLFMRNTPTLPSSGTTAARRQEQTKSQVLHGGDPEAARIAPSHPRFNILIIRAFVKLRDMLATHKDLAARMEKLEATRKKHSGPLLLRQHRYRSSPECKLPRPRRHHAHLTRVPPRRQPSQRKAQLDSPTIYGERI
jgi:hypothetical protein